MSRARWFHLLTCLVAATALVLQFVLIWQGHRVLEETARPDRATRVVRYWSYLTIWGNVLVCWAGFTLASGRDRDTRRWRALHLDAVVLIAVIAIVHFFFLRPHLHLHGADLVADKLLHMVVPALAVLGWLVFGPRGRTALGDLAAFLVVPVVWLAYTLIRGAVVGWYPYPFIDVTAHGYGVVLLNCAGVAALMIALFAGALRLDARLSRARPSP